MFAVIGWSYKNVALSTLAAISKSSEEVASLIQDAIARHPGAGFVWLNTCNRVELYADLPVNCEAAAKNIFHSIFNHKELSQVPYYLFREDAAYHLFKVAAGLEAAIIGEVQIIHQLKTAYSHSLKLNASSPLLNKVFHKAFQTGKYIRTHTPLNKGNVSVVSTAIEMAAQYSHGLENKKILILGAGKTGALLAKILKTKKATLKIWNRTATIALKVAAAHGITAVEFDIEMEIRKADIIFVAIGYHHQIFDFENIIPLNAANKVLVDLSLPLQIQSNEQLKKKHHLILLDNILAKADAQLQERKNASLPAHHLIEEAVQSYAAEIKQQYPIDQSIRNWKIKIDTIKHQLIPQYATADNNDKVLKAFADQFSHQLLKHIANDIRSKEKQAQEEQLFASLLNHAHATIH